MTFIGIPPGTKGYLFMRSPNNVVFTAAKALFDETLYPKCPDMHHSGLTPVDPEPQGEHNIPSGNEDNYGEGDVDDGFSNLQLPPQPYG